MRILIPLFVMIFFLAFMAWANIYLARSFGTYFDIRNLRPLYWLFALITVFMIGGLAGFTNTSSQFGSLLYKKAAVFMGLILYLFITVIIINLLSLVINIQPLYKGIIVLIVSVTVSGLGVINSYIPRVNEVEVSIEGLKQELVAVHLSDIHLGHFRGQNFLGKIVSKSNTLNPDLVFITGDLFDGVIKLKGKTLEPLRELKGQTYFVEGNHDGYSGVKKIKNLVGETGVRVLENEVDVYNDLQIVGLNHMLPDTATVGMHATIRRETMKNILPGLGINHDAPSILLHHSPDGIKFASLEGIDLYLSGHTHAGQLFPITLINDLIFKYNKGLDIYENTRIFVSEGIGTFGPPMRVGTKCEIALIKLVPATKVKEQ